MMRDGQGQPVSNELILFVYEQRLKEGQFISAEDVAYLIEAADSKLPEWLRGLACRHLRNQIPRKRGRPPKDETDEVWLESARIDYKLALRFFRARKKRPKPSTRGTSKAKSDSPDHEIALEMVFQHYRKKFGAFRHIGIKRFRDLLSS